MSKSILMHENGGPEKMQLEDVEVGSPGPGQVKIKHTAIGLNFIDVYTRSGLYQTPMPNAVGREAAGVIVEVGPKVKGFKKGDRVAYCGVLGAYCQERLMGVEQLVHVPKGVSDEQAAAIMLKGMTTEYLVDHCAKPWLKKGDIVLFHAAAGGVGLLFGQWAKARGYKAIGTVSSPEKAALAKKNGYKWVIDYTKENVAEKVKAITKGKGVPVVFDGVGKDTWEASLDSLQPRGLLASFGNASGPVAPVPPGVLNTKGSLYLTRPSLGAYTATRKDLEASAKSLFKMVKSGKVKIAIDQRYPLGEAAQAHIDLEGRKTTGRPSSSPDGAEGVQRSMMIVGLTGSIGMGKSTAARMLRQMGVPVYDADAAVHALQAPGGAALPPIEAAFPGVVKNGVLDRQALGARVFGNKAGAAQARSHRPSAGRPAAARLPEAGRAARRKAGRARHPAAVRRPGRSPGRRHPGGERARLPAAPSGHGAARHDGRPARRHPAPAGARRPEAAQGRHRHPDRAGAGADPGGARPGGGELRRRRGRFWPPNPWREKFTARLARARRK